MALISRPPRRRGPTIMGPFVGPIRPNLRSPELTSPQRHTRVTHLRPVGEVVDALVEQAAAGWT